MKPDVLNHPAVQFGRWLRNVRRERRVVARVFAGRVELSPAKYAEVESGIIEWIGGKQESHIPVMLDFNPNQESQFREMLATARELPPLTFSDVYSREEMAPARCCTADGRQIDAATKEAILDAVFKPLSRDD
jgi:hypothetical protein